jgi:hypothetical protein
MYVCMYACMHVLLAVEKLFRSWGGRTELLNLRHTHTYITSLSCRLKKQIETQCIRRQSSADTLPYAYLLTHSAVCLLADTLPSAYLLTHSAFCLLADTLGLMTAERNTFLKSVSLCYSRKQRQNRITNLKIPPSANTKMAKTKGLRRDRSVRVGGRGGEGKKRTFLSLEVLVCMRSCFFWVLRQRQGRHDTFMLCRGHIK